VHTVPESAEATTLATEMQNGAIVEHDHTGTTGKAGLLKAGLAVYCRCDVAKTRPIPKALTPAEGAHFQK
jgi:hypothetical protein